MTLQHAVLEMTADPLNEGERKHGVFQLVGNLEVQSIVEADYFIASGQGSSINSIITETLQSTESYIDKTLNPNQHKDTLKNKRQGFYLDLGGGKHRLRLNFIGWEGAEDPQGDPVMWGDQGGVNGADANKRLNAQMSNDDPLTQMQILEKFVKMGEYDSREPRAYLHIGQHSNAGTFFSNSSASVSNWPGGFFDPIYVTFPRMSFTRDAENPQSFDGSVEMVATQNWTDVFGDLGSWNW